MHTSKSIQSKLIVIVFEVCMQINSFSANPIWEASSSTINPIFRTNLKREKWLQIKIPVVKYSKENCLWELARHYGLSYPHFSHWEVKVHTWGGGSEWVLLKVSRVTSLNSHTFSPGFTKASVNVKSRQCPYLCRLALKWKNKGTLFCSTLKVEVNKVPPSISLSLSLSLWFCHWVIGLGLRVT